MFIHTLEPDPPRSISPRGGPSLLVNVRITTGLARMLRWSPDLETLQDWSFPSCFRDVPQVRTRVRPLPRTSSLYYYYNYHHAASWCLHLGQSPGLRDGGPG